MATKLKAKSPALSIRRKPKMLLYGKSGVGKTFGALDFPKCYYIDTEGGAKEEHYTKKLIAAGAGYFGPEDGANDLKEILGQIKALATEKHEYVTLIIDSITKPFNTMVGLEQERMAAEDIEDAFGSSRKPAVSVMRSICNWLDRIDMNVLVIAHAKDDYQLVGKKREAVGQTFDAWDKLEYELEMAFQVEKFGPARKMKIRKSRIQAFEEGKSYPWSYDSFADLYGRETIERGVIQVALATEEQVSEIKRLCELLKVSPEERTKWLQKAKADSFTELSEDQAAKTLAFLQSKIEGKEAA